MEKITYRFTVSESNGDPILPMSQASEQLTYHIAGWQLRTGSSEVNARTLNHRYFCRDCDSIIEKKKTFMRAPTELRNCSGMRVWKASAGELIDKITHTDSHYTKALLPACRD